MSFTYLLGAFILPIIHSSLTSIPHIKPHEKKNHYLPYYYAHTILHISSKHHMSSQHPSSSSPSSSNQHTSDYCTALYRTVIYGNEERISFIPYSRVFLWRRYGISWIPPHLSWYTIVTRITLWIRLGLVFVIIFIIFTFFFFLMIIVVLTSFTYCTVARGRPRERVLVRLPST